jgi:prepilin-type N-terminal cleavage/methylation domain-containing protein/prepilin-type processing-associated H-X9-DG protein
VRLRCRAFTLIELLVVMAIMAVLCAMLFPVFAAGRSNGKRISCLSHFRQVSLATRMYSSDYDDLFMPINHEHIAEPTSRNDRTWVQLDLPYVRNFTVFYCPSDISDRPRPEATFDEDLVPGDTDTQYYTASQRVNMGYNYQYLAPLVQLNGQYESQPKMASQIARPSETILFADSVWARKEDGSPTGGGSWLVVPPCRYAQSASSIVDTFTGSTTETEVFTNSFGWRVRDDGSPLIYGGAWPWHTGKVNIAYVDGSARDVTTQQLGAGCDVQNDWKGYISDPDTYMWDAR